MPASKPVPRVSIAETLFYFPQYYKNYLGGLEYLRKTKGDAFSFTFPKKTLFLMNPSHVDAVLIKNAKHFRKSDNYKADLGLLGNSLLTTEGEEWRRKRKAIAPEFHLTQISKFDDLFLKKIDAQIDYWKGEKRVDVFSNMQQFSFEVAGEGFFGAETGEQAKQVMSATRQISRISMQKLLFPWMRINQSKVDKSLSLINDVVADLVHEKKKKGSGCPVDLLKRLLDMSENMQEIRDQAVTVLLAGHDTTTHALTWLLHLLLWNPEQKQELENRLTRELGSNPPLGNALDAVTSVDEAIDEALRLYPSVPVISRNALDDQEVSGIAVKKGNLVQLSPWVTHRHPDFWTDPEKFDPSRFSAAKKALIPSGAYFPFGAGPRECVGEHFARRQMKVAIIRILQRCTLQPANRHPTSVRAVVLPHPSRPIWMNVQFK